MISDNIRERIAAYCRTQSCNLTGIDFDDRGVMKIDQILSSDADSPKEFLATCWTAYLNDRLEDEGQCSHLTNHGWGTRTVTVKKGSFEQFLDKDLRGIIDDICREGTPLQGLIVCRTYVDDVLVDLHKARLEMQKRNEPRPTETEPAMEFIW